MVAPRRFALIGHTHNLDDLVGDSDDIDEGTTNLFFTDERARDAVGAILTDTASVDLVYTDAGAAAGTITATVLPAGVDHNSLANLTTGDPHTQYQLEANLTEDVQDIVGALLVDSTTIDFTYSDGGNSITVAVIPGGVNHDALLNFVANKHIDHTAVTLTAGAGLTGGGDISASRSFAVGAGTGITVNADDVQIATAFQGANPSATIGLAAVNGTATTTMRSDAAPALSQAIAPTWTNSHIWTDGDAVVLGTGSDLSIYHDGTDTWLDNVTGNLKIRTVDAKAIQFYTDTHLSGYFSAEGLNAGGGFVVTGQLNAFPAGGITLDYNPADSRSRLASQHGSANAPIVCDNVTQFQAAVGSASVPVYSFNSDKNTGIYANGSDAIIYSLGGTARVTMEAPGAGSAGYLQLHGTTYTALFGYQTNEDIYLRAGKAAGSVVIGDVNAGVTLGASGVPTTVSGLLNCGAPITTKGYTVATLPAGVTGMLAHVTDALTPTFGATAVGGGAVKLPVFYNGTNWVTI